MHLYLQALTELGDPLTEEEVEKFFSVMDINKDRALSYHEFCEFLKYETQLMDDGGEADTKEQVDK